MPEINERQYLASDQRPGLTWQEQLSLAEEWARVTDSSPPPDWAVIAALLAIAKQGEYIIGKREKCDMVSHRAFALQAAVQLYKKAPWDMEDTATDSVLESARAFAAFLDGDE